MARTGSYWFQRIARQGAALGISIDTRKASQESRDWFRKKAGEVRGVDPKRLISETPSRLFTKMNENYTGSMVHFFYSAKWKDKLPYWDAFPLVFPIEQYGASFLGINMHYLPPILRAKLMNALYTTAVKNEQERIQRLAISYQILKNATKFSAFKPCVKQYLKAHVRSRFFKVHPEEWDMALFLPTARWQSRLGYSEAKVWRDSREKIRNG